LSIEEDGGVLVGQVVDGSPADQAGIKEGDVILKVDGTAVESPETLGELIRAKSDGELVNIQLQRGEETRIATVTLAAAPEGFQESTPAPGRGHNPEWFGGDERENREPAKHGYLGVMTQPLSKELGEYFGIKEGSGALVSEVVESSPADKVGLRAGDVITQIDDREIEGPGDLLRTMRDIEEAKTVKVTWIRDKKTRHGSVELEVRDAARRGRDARRAAMPRRFDHFRMPPMNEGEMSALKAELESLRDELQSMRLEMQKMKQDLQR
jgi:S1-C subfamily serine protease